MPKNVADPDAVAREDTNYPYELFIAAVSVFALLIMFVYYLAPTSAVVNQVLTTVDLTVIVPVLLFDFGRSLLRSKRKIHYLITWGWVDFLGSLPVIILLRLLRLGRVLVVWVRLRRATPQEIIVQARQQVAQSTLLVVTFLVIVLMTVGSIAIVSVESQSPAANIQTGDEALWWSIVTVATVGYGDYSPVTQAGRLIAVLFIVVGVSIFGVLTSYLSTMFRNRYDRNTSSELREIRAELAQMRELLQQLAQTPVNRD